MQNRCALESVRDHHTVRGSPDSESIMRPWPPPHGLHEKWLPRQVKLAIPPPGAKHVS